jgi:hypothetical protein
MRVFRTLIAFLFIAASINVQGARMTDLWWNPSESGWGANIIEQEGLIFITLFLYGSDGRPTWYVGSNEPLVSSSSSSRVYSGALYATTGTWFGNFSFNPNAVGVRQVGNVTFTATTNVSGTLAYSVDGVSVTKTIQRQAFKHINLSGTFYGAMDFLSVSTCALSAAQNQPFFATQAITATVNAAGSGGGITIAITDPSGTSVFAGTYTQYGSLYEVRGTLTINGVVYNAAITDFTADDDGIRGNLLAQAGCTLNVRFAAVRPG